MGKILQNTNHIRLWFFSALFAFASLSVGLLANPSVAQAASCENVEIPVALAPGLPKNQKIVGEHCTPSSPSIVRSIDVLVPGATYDNTYWDFPYNNYQYSYVKRTLQANRATFNFDRIGSGQSSKPVSATVTLDVDAYTLHQAIQWLKSNRNYLDVTTVGHSAGSLVAIREAAIHNDVNRLVATGLIHSPSLNLILGATNLYPAALDPQFIGKVLDVGYVTTKSGERGSLFYSSSADPAVIAYDESHKSFISGTEAAAVIAQAVIPPALSHSKDVKVPVLTIVGDKDLLCGVLVEGADCSSDQSVFNYEKPYYPNSQSYTAKIVPNTGHNLPLHPSADESFSMIDQWIKQH